MACREFAELRSVAEQGTIVDKERHESHRPRDFCAALSLALPTCR
jgi:hypothetical protein